MRLTLKQRGERGRDQGRADLLALGWSGLGKLVQIESLALMGMHFEETAAADTTDGDGEARSSGDAA